MSEPTDRTLTRIDSVDLDSRWLYEAAKAVTLADLERACLTVPEGRRRVLLRGLIARLRGASSDTQGRSDGWRLIARSSRQLARYREPGMLYVTLQTASDFGPGGSSGETRVVAFRPDDSVCSLKIGDRLPLLRKARELSVGDGFTFKMPNWGDHRDLSQVFVVRGIHSTENRDENRLRRGEGAK